MADSIRIEIENDLADRARALASRRGISLDQLIAQQLERLVSNDEYATARRQLKQGYRRNPSEQLLRNRIQNKP